MNIGKKTAFSLLLLAVLLIASFAPACTTTEEQTPEEIVIGAVLPLSGNMEEYGTKARTGMDLAVSDINEEGGIDGARIVIRYNDTASNPEMAVSGYKSLVEAGIPVIIGDVTSAGTLAIAPYTEEYGVVLISPTATNPEISNFPYVYRIIASDRYQGRGAAKILSVLHPGVKKVAVVYADDEYGRGLSSAFAEATEHYGLDIVIEIPLTPDKDQYDMESAMICNADPDAVFFVGYTREAGKIIRKVHTNGLDPVWFGSDSIVTEDFIRSAGNLSEGVTATMQSIYLDEDFRDRYEEIYGDEEADWIFCYGYETVMILEDAIDIGSYSPEGIKEGLSRIRHIGIIGPKVFDKNGDVPPSFKVLQVENAEWQRIKWKEILSKR